MKRIKAIVTLFAVLAMFLLPTAGLTAEASNPVTYSVKCLGNQWRYQANTSKFDEGYPHREVYYMLQEMKDGDIVVVYSESDSAPDLNLGSIKLSNLTVVTTAKHTIIFSGDITDAFILGNTSVSLNCNVTNGHVYDPAVASFNGNVQNLTLYKDGHNANTNISCAGVVDQYRLASMDGSYTYFQIYNFHEGKFQVMNGNVTTPDWAFSWNAPAAAAPTQAPAAAPAPQPQQPAQSSGQYDSVPKTGDSSMMIALLSAASLCMAGSFTLKRKAN